MQPVFRGLERYCALVRLQLVSMKLFAQSRELGISGFSNTCDLLIKRGICLLERLFLLHALFEQAVYLALEIFNLSCSAVVQELFVRQFTLEFTDSAIKMALQFVQLMLRGEEPSVPIA